ncbi:TRAP transporter large permease [Hydrogenophaga sp.]|uniref:TRAP transporter large permease n=1 Tax=Hydrogenophaga sp. TaxID=1904254 RepID=UPI0027268388|nr:TRAP transporter large permease [Hydrogenophaga sp.]MDO8905322.1 TRAP transporter large permease [Hydrogenophaga sp.]
MSTTAWILTAGFTALVLMGMPFAFAIALSVIVVLLVVGIEPMLLPQTLIAGTQSFSLLAIPFFMLAGELMLAGGLSQRLVRVAEVFVRHLPGGLGLVVVLAALVFAAVSGSAPATTAAIGAVMIPAMAERGYDRAYATALVVSAGVLAPLVPPSIAFVIWGVIAEQSISKLFLSGVVPALLMATGMVVLIVFKALRERREREPRASWRERLAALREGIWALLAPAVVLGGIYGGAFTPTEAAVVVCVYALVVGLLIERRLQWRELPAIVARAMSISGVVMAVVAVSAGFGFLVAQEQLATKLAVWLATQFENRWSMLMALNLGFFAMAAVMDEIAIMVILGPMLIGIANQFGVDPIHFGAMIVTNVAIGMATPPIGYCLFVGMAIGGVKLWPLSRAMLPFIAMMLVVLLLVTYVPQVALLLIR